MDKTYFALLNQVMYNTISLVVACKSAPLPLALTAEPTVPAQLLETIVGLGVIGLVVKRSQPFPEDVFRLSLKYVNVLPQLPGQLCGDPGPCLCFIPLCTWPSDRLVLGQASLQEG